MASLGEILSALLTQVGQGRSHADMATLQLAQAYRDHPLLSEFPVPRMTLDEVVLDLKVAVATVQPAPSKSVLTTGGRDRVIAATAEGLSKMAAEIEPLRALADSGAWEALVARARERLAQLLPVDGEVDVEALSYSGAAVLRGEIAASLYQAGPDVMLPSRLERALPEGEPAPPPEVNLDALEGRLREELRSRLIPELEVRAPSGPERLEVLVTASELESVPPERITSVRLSLREADRAWTTVEVGDGGTRDKLVPP